ncbi:MAG: endonuclease/exonuclease/phosphatase family protein [Planctomycetes bacterium]|nr:endonuclease/exonuclease/phosphatase family protein [Planctomycetota bacterium]
MRRFLPILMLSLVLSIFTIVSARAEEPPASRPEANFKVMSFNVRASALDLTGDHTWRNRRDAARKVLEENEPDILGLQEALPNQVSDVQSALPDHESHAAAGGGLNTVFIRKGTFEVLDEGSFWHSDAGARLQGPFDVPRFTYWLKLRHVESEREFIFANTHFSSQSGPMRELAARLSIENFREFSEALPVIYLGDFNSEPTHPAYSMLTSVNGHEAAGGYFRDAFPVSGQREDVTASVTAHDWRGVENKIGHRIDHVLLAGEGVRANSWRCVQTTYDDVFPSDHFPVTAEVTLFDKRPEETREGSSEPEGESVFSFTVMSYNIRSAMANEEDRWRAWEMRRDGVMRIISAKEPDILCVQEATAPYQVQILQVVLPGYVASTPMVPSNTIFYKESLFEAVSQGFIWHTEQFDFGALRGRLGGTLPGMTYYLKLRHKETGGEFVIANTQLGDDKAENRLAGAKRILERLKEDVGKIPVILVGDFCSDIEDSPAQVLLGNESDGGVSGFFRDAFGASDLEQDAAEAQTFDTWNEETGAAERHDNVFVSGNSRASAWSAIQDRIHDDVPSDHFPVLATIEVTEYPESRPAEPADEDF